APADVAGRWALFWTTPAGPAESGYLVLRQDGGRVEAELHGRGSLRAEGRVRGELLVISGRRLLAAFELRATVRGDSLVDGTLRVQSTERAFTAVRRRPPEP
ncbi:MAG TPA: hypothetical protein VFQ45_22020, partial [Longimicrobium sp.]|nr:hypothetical protein [Longimicrobium sp.]